MKDEGSPPYEILLTFHLEWCWERGWFGAWQGQESVICTSEKQVKSLNLQLFPPGDNKVYLILSYFQLESQIESLTSAAWHLDWWCPQGCRQLFHPHQGWAGFGCTVVAVMLHLS